MKVIVFEGEVKVREGFGYGFCRVFLIFRLFMEGFEEASMEILGKLIGYWRVGWRVEGEVCCYYMREVI